MAKVTVVYDDLQSSANNLKGVKDYVDKAAKQIQTVKSNVSASGAKHDNCYKETIAALEDLEKVFANYSLELSFLIEQCTAAYEAFKNAEADSTNMTEQMKQVVSGMAAMLGMEGFSPDGTELDIHKDSSDLGDTSNRRATAAQRSETWNRIFEDSDSDGDYDKINGTTVSSSESTLDENKDKDTSTDTSGGGGSPSGGGGGGGGGGNPHYK